MPEHRNREGRDGRPGSRRYSSASPSPPRRRRSRSREDRKETYRKERPRSRDRRHSHEADDTKRGEDRDSYRRRDILDDKPSTDFRPSKKRRSRSPSHSRSQLRHKADPRTSLQPLKRSDRPLPSQQDAFTKDDPGSTFTPPVEKQAPNLAPTGLLAAASNTIQASGGQTVILKYHEPPEARKPASKDAWRMYIFKGADIVDTVELAQQSCWLVGREAAVADLLVEHPSCSKQHAVLQFRYIEKSNEFGDKKGRVKPYVIDLESANGTKVNGEEIPGGRYMELRDSDVIMFGHSTREYVVQLPPAG